eukprot:c21478_g1_i1 orf=349-1350(-)
MAVKTIESAVASCILQKALTERRVLDLCRGRRPLVSWLECNGPSGAVVERGARASKDTLSFPRRTRPRGVLRSDGIFEKRKEAERSDDTHLFSFQLYRENNLQQVSATRCKEVMAPSYEFLHRRVVLLGMATSALKFCETKEALAAQQNLLAGRIPGLSSPDENGIRTYHRPDLKSGGHGVGWSPIIPYSFKVHEEWEEVPVSIADLGGTEIDLRFSSQKEGNLSVVVAPILRFSAELGDDVRIEDIGPPEKVIYAFGPELIGQNVEGKVKTMEVMVHNGRKYYQYEIDGPHAFITATAAGNRLYLITISANGRQWKKYNQSLRQIANSFQVG